jgi:aspartyl-tRNA(Asn)/glutamyl-tRNA(Gln) amidotransferase subunit C
MKISADQTRHIARLARLQLDEEQVERMARQLGAILGYVEKLGELDTDTVEPTSHALAVTNVWRPDMPAELACDRDLLFGQAPRFEQGFYVVPKVLE